MNLGKDILSAKLLPFPFLQIDDFYPIIWFLSKQIWFAILAKLHIGPVMELGYFLAASCKLLNITIQLKRR